VVRERESRRHGGELDRGAGTVAVDSFSAAEKSIQEFPRSAGRTCSPNASMKLSCPLPTWCR
jgi:hypothetical protein